MLTDIEGSTRLWQAAPDAMVVAVARHYELLDAAISAHGGVRPVEQGEGDSIVAAFERPSEALAAALEAQLALASEPWPGGAELRVRIALHTGEAELRDASNYAGVALSRCARLRGLAAGGQVLLSGATRDLVADTLPEGAEVRDLGTHALRDLERPERVFALVHPKLAEAAPLPAPAEGPPSNLPAELTSFVGRERELEEARAALSDTRLLTLTGAGGAGKTRLAIRLCAQLTAGHPDGTCWVELAAVTDPAMAGPALAQLLGVRPLPGQSDLDAVALYLSTRTALVCLDNCEHLIDGAVEVADTLLRACPSVTVVATSREPLRLAGETEWRVPSLSLPAEEEAGAGSSDALVLFRERARKVKPGFEITDENRATAAAICRSLDGMPLAIELAAARLRHLSPAQIADGLSDRFRLLRGGDRATMPRQQTLRASVEWSHDLLSDDEQVLLRRLGVFIGGFTLEAAESVCAAEPLEGADVLELLASLIDKSLVQSEERGAELRYTLLETVRQFALERLEAEGELDGMRDRHRDWFVVWSADIGSALMSPRHSECLDLLDAEAANLEVATDRAADTDAEKALRLCEALFVWWLSRGGSASAEAACARALGAAEAQERSPLRARVMGGRAYLRAHAGRFEEAIRLGEDALEEAEAVGDRRAEIGARNAIGIGLFVFADLVAAREQLASAYKLAQATGDEWGAVVAAQNLAYSHFFNEEYEPMRRLLDAVLPTIERIGLAERLAWHYVGHGLARWATGEHSKAREMFDRGIAAGQVAGEPNVSTFGRAWLCQLDADAGRADQALQAVLPVREHGLSVGAGLAAGPVESAAEYIQAAAGDLQGARTRIEVHLKLEVVDQKSALYARCWLAETLRLLGEPEEAASVAAQARERAERLDNRFLVAVAELTQGRLAAQTGEWAKAQVLLDQALDVFSAGGFRLYLPRVLEALAEVAAGLESHEEAARILGAAARVREDTGLVAWKHQREEVEELRQRVRDALGPEAFGAAHAEGAALEEAEAIAWLRRARGERKRPSGGWESLTPTEVEVARRIHEGLTNPEIAERMFVSRSTVKTHLSHIYAKLDISGRAELAREAAGRLEA